MDQQSQATDQTSNRPLLTFECSEEVFRNIEAGVNVVTINPDQATVRCGERKLSVRIANAWATVKSDKLELMMTLKRNEDGCQRPVDGGN
jgi:hypothetical protein